MAASKFFHLDSVGLDQSFFLNQDLESTLYSNKLFNLGFNNLNTQLQIEQNQKGIYNLLKDQSYITFKQFNFLIESYLNQLLFSSSITNLEKSSLSSHFAKYKQVQDDHLCKSISSEFLEDLLFTNSKVWGGQYGSPLYHLYLGSEKEHYLHPSQITELVIKNLNNSSSSFSSTYSDLLSLSFSDKIVADELIYKVPSNLILRTPLINSSFALLNFFLDWIPQVINWYLEPLTNSYLERTISSEVDIVLEKIAKRCLYYGLDASSFQLFTFFDFIHQDIPLGFINLIEDILSIRKTLDSNLEIYKDTLIQELINNISLDVSTGLFREVSLLILKELCPPGGYNLLLIFTALSLLNRAYIISHSSNNPYSEINIFPLDIPFDPILQLVGRTLKLVYLAGYTLTKSNLEHLNIIGFNLMQITNLSSDFSIQSKNLID